MLGPALSRQAGGAAEASGTSSTRPGTLPEARRAGNGFRDPGIVAKRRKKFRATTDSKHAEPIASNALNRDFDVALPNTSWVTDVTYVATLQGWLYLAAILCARRVVGWATSLHNDRQLALDALDRAAKARTPLPGLLHHSDRGSTYASGDYRHALTELAMIPSMSREGDCWDNAVAESFFATIKWEMLGHESFETRAQATAAIADYIDGFYNVHRLHSSNDYVPD